MSNTSAQSWYPRAAERMVRELKTLAMVATELEIPITSREAIEIERSKPFQRELWTQKHKLYKELASDPNRSKSALIGQMVLIADKLMAERKYDKAADALLKLAKIEGYVGEQTVNVFSLTDSEIEAAKAKVRKLAAGEGFGDQSRPN